jgi:hypothetical protein
MTPDLAVRLAETEDLLLAWARRYRRTAGRDRDHAARVVRTLIHEYGVLLYAAACQLPEPAR